MSYSEKQIIDIDSGFGPVKPVHVVPPEQAYLSSEMRRFANVLERAASTFMSVYSEAQERAQEITEKNAKNAKASAEKSARLESRRMRHAVIGLAVSIAVAATGVIGSGLNERTKHLRAFETDEFRRKLERLDRISAAFTEIRKVKEEARVDCGTPRYDIIEINHKRVQARFELFKETRNADYYFDNDVLAATKEFVTWEMSFPDYCAKDLPHMDEWRSRQRRIEDIIRGTIKHPVYQ
jgi:hypothetical protein